jgi:hypothetical protein
MPTPCGKSDARGHQRRPSAQSTLRCPRFGQEQGNNGVDEAQQVVLTKLREGLVGSPL